MDGFSSVVAGTQAGRANNLEALGVVCVVISICVFFSVRLLSGLHIVWSKCCAMLSNCNTPNKKRRHILDVMLIMFRYFMIGICLDTMYSTRFEKMTYVYNRGFPWESTLGNPMSSRILSKFSG